MSLIHVNYQGAKYAVITGVEVYTKATTTGITGSPTYLIRSSSAPSAQSTTLPNGIVHWFNQKWTRADETFMPPVVAKDMTSAPVPASTSGITGSPKYGIAGVAHRLWPSQPVTFTEEAVVVSSVYPADPAIMNTPVTI